MFEDDAVLETLQKLSPKVALAVGISGTLWLLWEKYAKYAAPNSDDMNTSCSNYQLHVACYIISNASFYFELFYSALYIEVCSYICLSQILVIAS